MPDITSANAIITMAVPLLLPVPQQIQGFSTDDIFSVTRVKTIQTEMGLDGNLSFGFLFVEKPMEITLMAGSPSNSFFEAIQAAQEAGVVPLEIQGLVSLPSIGAAYILQTGVLSEYPPIADGKKTMMPRKYGFVWERIFPSPISLAG